MIAAAAGAVCAEPLTMPEAIRSALGQHPSLQAAAAEVRAAGTRVNQASSGYLPRASYTESFQRGNNPVFAFSALLSQRRFAESNFSIPSLNNPDFINNYQSRVAVEQTVWDAGRTRAMTEMARLGADAAEQKRAGERLQIAGRVAAAYLSAQLAREARSAADAGLASAEADLEIARNKRTAGMSTDADVLAIEVHLAEAREAQVRWRGQEAVALAALNEAMGRPVDSTVELAPLSTDGVAGRAVGSDAEARPETAGARIGLRIAEAQARAARSAFWPQLIAMGSFEANRGRPFTQGGGMWFAGATLRWDFFNGGREWHARNEADFARRASASRLEAAVNAVRLDVRRAETELATSRERLRPASGAVAIAEEVVRITRNRFGAGLTTAADLLRHETALTNARLRQHQAVHDERLAAIVLELASGRLDPDSEVYR